MSTATFNQKLKFEASFETSLLVDRLSQASIGDIVTYEELSQIIGDDVRLKHYQKLRAARRRVLADFGFVFSPTGGIGLKLLNDHEKVESFASDTDSIRRKSNLAIKKASTVDIGQLDNEERKEFNVRVSLFAALRHATSDRSVKLLSKAVEKSQQQLPLAKTLEAFK